MSTKLINSPYTETSIDGAHSLVYTPGVEPVRYAGQDEPLGPLGTYGRGLHRVSGFVFSHDGDAAEKLLSITDEIELIVYYLSAQNEHRKRRLVDVVFVGDATVRVPPSNTGLSDLIGVPFKVNIPEDETLADHVIDEAE
jgi:hypothetical protein